jgi:nicotinamide N-methyltransferase
MTQWKNQVTSQESEGELSEARSARSRSGRSFKLVNKAPKNRNRSGTTSSVQTAANHTDEGTVSPAPTHPRLPLRPSTADRSGTPTEIRSSSETSRDMPPPMRRIPSGVSLTATRPASSPIPPSEMAPTTPSLTPGVSTTTDDEETDFQSAYSASPRESYGEFDEKNGNYEEPEDETVSLEKDHKSNFGQHSVSALSKLQRERVSSTATAVQRHHQAQPSPTLSEDTVISRRGTSKRILTEA